ncbi:MAG TPA: SRPBCC family protein [Candidatus Binatus sp.]|uniref:SRPBCC family protein n=1 Tax=Candidatus Binatus sp. TaxID=2811406 RepID=UPI002B4838E8|nr:SRPBCC family protein [Candidatus Binatus sp.]HKN13928.1 SRPBCC family protein [Candidatus Binatus sp.]
MPTNTDRIEKRVLLRAPRDRVWRAISESSQFGAWFGVKFDGPFVPGASIIGSIVPTTVDPEVAKSQKPYEGYRFEFSVDRIEPMRFFSFRWHPFAVDPAVDYSKEPSTLVAFELEEVSGGTMLTVTESGFDQIPLERRAKAFAANEQGWAAQMTLIEKYLAQQAQG